MVSFLGFHHILFLVAVFVLRSRRKMSHLHSFNGISGVGCLTATIFNIPHFDNPVSCYYQPKNYLINSSLRTQIMPHSAFKNISLIHSDAYE